MINDQTAHKITETMAIARTPYKNMINSKSKPLGDEMKPTMLENSMKIAGTYNAEASKRMKTGVMRLANNMHTINRHSSEPTLLGFRRRIRSTRPTIGKPKRNVSSQIVINAQVA